MRKGHLPALALLALSLTACGGGPTNRELCLAITAVLPAVYGLTLAILAALEWVRAAPDRDARSLVRRAGALAAGAAVAGGVVVLLGGVPSRGDVILVFLAFGAVALLVSLVTWRARARAPYASRVLVAATLGSGLGAPAWVLWPDALDTVSGYYILALTFASLLFSIYAAPIALLGLVVEGLVRRSRAR